MAGWIDPDALPCAWARVGADGRLQQANAPLRELLGAQAEDLVGRHIDTLLAGGGRLLYYGYFVPLLRLHGRARELALALRAQDGSTVEVLAYAHALPPPPEGARHIELVLLPMSERRRLEDELLRIRRAAERAPGMLFQYVRGAEGHGAFAYASDAMRRLYGLVPAQVHESDEAWLDRIHPEDRGRVRAVLQGLPAAEEPWRERYRVSHADGTVRWHALQAMPSIGSDGRVLWHGYVDDITEQLAMEQAAREKEAAESASQAKSDFLARASHELRTPLNAILGFAQLMELEGGSLDGEQKRQLSLIGASGRELLRLVDDMLDIARIEADRAALQPAMLPLAPLLESALQSVRPLSQAHGVALQLIDAPAALHVRADERRLLQVLGHLLSNAVLYNRPGGHAWLAARADGDARVLIEISDDGVGLNEQQQAALFQPFNRLGAERGAIKGLGLGLTLVQRLLPLMDGSIAVASTPGRGSVFTVGLPGRLLDWSSDANAAAAPAGMPLEVPASAAPGLAAVPAAAHEVDVLYVEDNPVNALLMQTLFQMRPQWKLKVAVDGGSGIDEALRSPPRLLLLDMHLPDMTGIQVLARLRRHEALRAVPAIVVSAAAMSSDIEAAQAAGFAAYWTKPLDLPRMLAELDGLLGQAGPPASTGGL